MRYITNPVGAVTLATSLIGCSAAVLAQATPEPPDLTGTWKAIATAVSIGTNPYRPQIGEDGPYFSDEEIEFTFNIAEQRGARFAGTLSAGERTEMLIGGLRPPDFTAGIFLDDDGRYEFNVRNPGTMDLCYHHLRPEGKVVACYTVTKE
jgi:hypothetical protein